MYLGVFDRQALEEVGGFDPTLVRNQDFELNHRLREVREPSLVRPAARGHLPPPFRPPRPLEAVSRLRQMETGDAGTQSWRARGGGSWPRPRW